MHNYSIFPLPIVYKLFLAQHQNENDSEVDEEQEKPEIELPDGKIGAKKRAKLEAKAEKKAAREAEEQIRTERYISFLIY